MVVDLLYRAASIFEFISLAILLALFTNFAIKARSRSSLQFQLFIFLLIFVIAEIPRALWNIGLVDLSYYSQYGLPIHTLSMLLFAGFVIFKFRRTFGVRR